VSATWLDSLLHRLRYDADQTKLVRLAALLHGKRLRGEWEQIDLAAQRLTQAGQLIYTEISIAAKAYLLLDQRGHAAGADEIVVWRENSAGPLTRKRSIRQFSSSRVLTS
jgi:hypothetical protein